MGFTPSSTGSAPDGVTLETNVDGQLQIKDTGVDTTQLADDAVTLAKLEHGAIYEKEILHRLALEKMSVSDAQFVKNLFAESAEIDASSTAFSVISSGDVIVCDGLDEFGDSTIDATIWSTAGTPTNPSAETGGNLVVGGNYGGTATSVTATVTSSGSTGVDFKALACDSFIEIGAGAPGIGAGASRTYSQTVSLKIGATVVFTASQVNSTTPAAASGTYRIFLDYSAGLAYSYKDGVAVSGSPFDISGEATWRLAISCVGTISSAASNYTNQWPIAYVRTLRATGTAVDVITAAQSISAGQTKAIPYALATLNTCTLAYALSTDSGSNFQTHSNDKMPVTLSNVGTGLMHRFRFTRPAALTQSEATAVFPVVGYAYSWVFS